MALNANALTSIANVKSQLDLPPTANALQDARLEIFINAASQAIESYCNRKFHSQPYTEFRSGRRQNMLMPYEYPITAVTELNIDNSRQFLPATAVDSGDYSIADRGHTVLLNRLFPQGYGNIKLTYTAGYATIPADVELACIWAVEWFAKHRDRKDMGRVSSGKGDESVGILAQMPPMILEMIKPYKRSEFVDSESPIENG